MKRNKIFLFATLLLAIIAIILVLTSKKSTLNDEFSVKNPETITKLFLADKTNKSVLLEKQPDESWLINKKYPAQQEVVETMLTTLNEMRVREPVAKAAYGTIYRRMGFQNTKIEIYQTCYRINLFGKIKLFKHEKLTKTFYVGDETQDNMGTYMMMVDNKIPYVINIPGFRGFLSPRFSAREEDWRTHLIFNHKISDIRSVTVEVPRYPDLSFRIDRNQRQFTLTLLQGNHVVPAFDTLKVVDFMSSFSNIGMEAYRNNVDKAQRDTIFTKAPMQIVTLTDMKGKKITLKTYPKPIEQAFLNENNELMREFDKDRLYALINDDKDVALIQYPLFDRILKTADYFYPQHVDKK